MTGPVVETVTLARERTRGRPGPGLWVQTHVPEAHPEPRSASLHPVDEEGHQALVEAAKALIIDEVEHHLAWNLSAYGKAWTGEGEDTEFIVGKAAERVLARLGFSAPVVRAGGGER